jgi:5-formyltetrahydrofolate cyclo-ligase
MHRRDSAGDGGPRAGDVSHPGDESDPDLAVRAGESPHESAASGAGDAATEAGEEVSFYAKAAWIQAAPTGDADPSPRPFLIPAESGYLGPDRLISVPSSAIGASPRDSAMARAKEDLRHALAARRLATGPRIGAGPRGSDGGEIARRVLALPEIAVATWVAGFVGLAGEPDTWPLLAALRRAGPRVLLPAVRGDLDLDFREYTGAVVPGAMGTREPPPAVEAVDLARADVVLLPAVAVDLSGRRLGRGGGSYDRALRRVRAGATLVAVVDDQAIVDEVPVAAHDVGVSVIVTPTRVTRCR